MSGTQKTFSQSSSYAIGVLKKGETAANNPKPLFAPRKSITVQGATIAEKGAATVQEFFQLNPLGMKTGRETVAIFQIRPDGNREYFAEGVFFVPPAETQQLADSPQSPLLPPEEPGRNYYAPLREHNDTLRSENHFLKTTIEQQNTNIAQVLAQNNQFMERMDSLLEGRILAERKVMELEGILTQEKSLNQLRDDFRSMLEEQKEKHEKEVAGLSDNGLGFLESPLFLNLFNVLGPILGKKIAQWMDVDDNTLSPSIPTLNTEQMAQMQARQQQQQAAGNRYTRQPQPIPQAQPQPQPAQVREI